MVNHDSLVFPLSPISRVDILSIVDSYILPSPTGILDKEFTHLKLTVIILSFEDDFPYAFTIIESFTTK